MNLLLISDAHLEFHRDGGREFLTNLDPSGVDVLVVAGDLIDGRNLTSALEQLCERFKQVIFVMGNHELYGFDAYDADRLIKSKLPNLHWLERSTVTIEGVRFVGTTLWFPAAIPLLKRSYADFHWIKRYEPWVYEQHWDSVNFLKRTLQPDDVLVTHFLPLQESIAPAFEGHPMNCFFWSGPTADRVVRERSPKLILHGHTHSSLDYQVGDTRVVCNPFGYVGGDMNPLFDPRKIISLPPTTFISPELKL